MSGVANSGLIPARIGGTVLAYSWPTDVVITAGARAEAPSAARALSTAIARILANPRVGSLVPPAERAIVVGTQSAAIAETTRFAREIHEVGAALVNPGLFPLTVMNATSGLVAIERQCEGPNVTLCNGPASALDALVVAADLVVEGRATIAFAAGFETAAATASSQQAAAAVACAVMTGERARAAGAQADARLIATASAASVPDRSSADLAADLLAAAGQAGRDALGEARHGVSPIHLASAAEVLEALAEVIAGAVAEVTALVACRPDPPSGTALILVRATADAPPARS